MRRVGIVLGVAAALAAAAPASAMEVAMQDDLTVINTENNRSLALQQFVDMGGTNVRMTVEHNRRSSSSTTFAARLPVSRYDRAVSAVRSFGLEPQITMFWKGQGSPRKLAQWMGVVAQHFGGKVNRYSVYNEPDLYLKGAAPCDRAGQAQVARRFPGLVNGRRAVVATRPGFVALRRACQRYERGVQYRKLFDLAAPLIRKANVGAQVLAGETSPVRGLDWFFRGADARTIDADGWAHHPFQFTDLTPTRPSVNWGIGNFKLLKKTLRMPIYLTEFAYPRAGGRMDIEEYGRHITEAERAKAYVEAWSEAQRLGAKEMLQYLWFRKRNPLKSDWDTSLLGFDDGSLSQSYLALQKLIQSW